MGSLLSKPLRPAKLHLLNPTSIARGFLARTKDSQALTKDFQAPTKDFHPQTKDLALALAPLDLFLLNPCRISLVTERSTLYLLRPLFTRSNMRIKMLNQAGWEKTRVFLKKPSPAVF